MANKTLTDLANFYKSDKGNDAVGLRAAWGRGMKDEVHGYSLYYDRIFTPLQNNKLTIVEIGIADWRCPGASLKMWYEFFPNAQIYGFDNFYQELHILKKESVDPTVYENDRTKIYVGDQGDRDNIAKFVEMTGSIDILIEDGSHQTIHQMITLGAFFPAIKPGGIYVLEDMQIPMVSGGRHNFDNTETLNILKRYQQTGVFETEHMTQDEKNYLYAHIDHMELCFNDEFNAMMAVFYKKN